MKRLYISILESIYLIYMFLIFKTKTDFNILASPKNWLLKHNTGNEYLQRICPLGQIAVFLLVFVIIGRHYINISKNIINTILIIAIILSLINLNAFIYLLPVFIVEFILNK